MIKCGTLPRPRLGDLVGELERHACKQNLGHHDNHRCRFGCCEWAPTPPPPPSLPPPPSITLSGVRFLVSPGAEPGRVLPQPKDPYTFVTDQQTFDRISAEGIESVADEQDFMRIELAMTIKGLNQLGGKNG